MLEKHKKRFLRLSKPSIKSRFLPGEVNETADKLDLTQFLEHRMNVLHANPKVEAKAPIFDISIWYNRQNHNDDASRIQEVDKENMELLKKMNIIHRMGGKIDCWNKSKSAFVKSVRLNEEETMNRQILNNNKKILYLINTARSQYSTYALLRNWKDIKERMIHMSKYPLWTKKSQLTPTISPLSDNKNSISTRVRCFFDLEIAEENLFLGHLIFELYSDYVPKTCENFKAFCQGRNGYSYKGSPLHRILPGYWCQGGDITKFNGSGGTSIYGNTFEDENFDLKHNDAGILSMWSTGRNTNNSKFNLTFKHLKTMDGHRVVFGKIICGMTHLRRIENFGTKSGKPLKRIIISNCGVL